MIEIVIPAISRRNAVILHPLRLGIPQGQMLGIIGPNGAGKSTLLAAIAGQVPETVDLHRDGHPLTRQDIGHLPQNFAVRSTLTVLEAVLLGRREELGLRVPPALLEAALDCLSGLGLSELASRPLNALSGGQQQRVLLAQRLFRDPRLLLLDEPTSALDLHHQMEVLARLRAHARAAAVPVLCALHDLTLAARFCDRLIVLAAGQLVADGAPADVLTSGSIAAHWQIAPEILTCRTGHPVLVAHPLGAPGSPDPAPLAALHAGFT